MVPDAPGVTGEWGGQGSTPLRGDRGAEGGGAWAARWAELECPLGGLGGGGWNAHLGGWGGIRGAH